MKNYKILIVFMLTICVIMSACEEEDIMSYEGKPAVHFYQSASENYDSTYAYTFLYNPDTEYVQQIAVEIEGDSTDYDRFFNVEVINDSLTTATQEQFEILEGVVKAGAFSGVLNIRLYDAPVLDSTEVSLHLRIVESNDFAPGVKEQLEEVVTWSDKVVVPPWGYFRYFFTNVGSTAAYRIIVETTGLTQLTIAEYRTLGMAGATALATQFGDYVKQYNADHPGSPLLHDDGDAAGQEILPLYYTRSKWD